MPKEAIVTPVEPTSDDTPVEPPDDDALLAGDDQHEPPSDHPRFKEIYGKMKEGDRKVEQLETQITEDREMHNAIIEHNKALQETMNSVLGKVTESTEPDPQADPEAYKIWAKEKAEQEVKQTQPLDAQRKLTPQQESVKHKLALQESAMDALNDDYAEMAGIAKQDMMKDVVLRNEIFSSSNPAKAAYKHGKARKEKAAAGDQTITDQGFVEGSRASPTQHGKRKLTDLQKKMAMKFGQTEDEYREQLDFIESAKGEE